MLNLPAGRPCAKLRSQRPRNPDVGSTFTLDVYPEFFTPAGRKNEAWNRQRSCLGTPRCYRTLPPSMNRFYSRYVIILIMM